MESAKLGLAKSCLNRCRRSQSSLQAHQTEAAPGSTSLETGTDLIKIFFMLFMYGFSSGPIKIIFIVITFGGFVTGKRFSDVIVKPGGMFEL
jgi:hypothetical protein